MGVFIQATESIMSFVGNYFRPITRTLQRLPFLNRIQRTPSFTTCINHELRQNKNVLRSQGPGGLVLRSVSTAADAAVTNPLLSASEFPRFDSVKADHVGPGIRTLIKGAEENLEILERDLASLGNKITASELLIRLEKVSDSLSRAWSTCSHLRAGRTRLKFCYR